MNELVPISLIAATFLFPHGLAKLADSYEGEPTTKREETLYSHGLIVGQVTGLLSAFLIYKLYEY